jgi:hypothetical protein
VDLRLHGKLAIQENLGMPLGLDTSKLRYEIVPPADLNLNQSCVSHDAPLTQSVLIHYGCR